MQVKAAVWNPLSAVAKETPSLDIQKLYCLLVKGEETQTPKAKEPLPSDLLLNYLF